MRILLVDDEKMILESVGCFFEKRLGHQVTTCDNAQDAIEKFKRSPFPMVLSDIHMPGMDGIRLLNELKVLPKGKNADIVLITGYGDMQSAIEALQGGAYDYLLKPIELADLKAIVERVAEHQALLRENYELNYRFEQKVSSFSKQIKSRLQELQKAYAEIVGIGEVGIFSKPMQVCVEQAEQFHKDPSASVLIEGETGTGKEIIARLVHFGKGDVCTPFVPINCSAIPSHLFESELFGYEGGAFSGAHKEGSPGKLELAEDGTLFLDEIGEMPLEMQPKLLRVLEEREYYRVGGLIKHKFRARVICASNRNLRNMVKENKFRRDLYYRLNVVTITLPTLQEVPETIRQMAHLFLQQFSEQKKKRFKSIHKEAVKVLQDHSWPGNIRELKNAIERAVIMYDDIELKPDHLGFLETEPSLADDEPRSQRLYVDLKSQALPPDRFHMEEVEKIIIEKALSMHNGVKTRTADYLGINRSSLERRIKKYF